MRLIQEEEALNNRSKIVGWVEIEDQLLADMLEKLIMTLKMLGFWGTVMAAT